MLAGLVGDQALAVVRLQMERADRGAFIDDIGDHKGPPASGERLGLDAPVGQVPVAGHQRIGRPAVGAHRPAQRQRATPQDDAARAEGPEPLGTLECGDLGGIENDFGGAGHLQHIARRKIGEDQACARIGKDVAQCVEE